MLILIAFLLSATPRFMLSWRSPAPHHVTIKASVPPDTLSVSISLQNESYGRESAFATEDGRSTYWVEWRGVPSGVFTLAGGALNHSGRTAQSPLVNVVVQ